MIRGRLIRLFERRRTVVLAICLLPVLFFASGCNATFDVMVEVEDGGSGIVRTELVLDAEATAALLDLRGRSTLPLSDLANGGWKVSVDRSNGETRVTADKAFGTPPEFEAIMEELTFNTVIRDFVLTRTQSFGLVDYGVTGTLDTTEGLAVFSDPALEEALGESMIGIVTAPPYEASASDVVINLSVVLPGPVEDAGSTGDVVSDELSTTGEWQAVMSEGIEKPVVLLSSRRSTSAQVLRGVAVVAGALAALIAFAQLLRIVGGLRRKSNKPKVRPTDARGRSTSDQTLEQPAVEVEDPVDAFQGYKVVALDGMGVLYREGNDVKELLIPFARERGSTVSDEEITVKARLLSLGRMTPADFWDVIGVEGDPNELDASYLATHQLMPGVVKYLRSLRDNGRRAACITNDAAAWATKLRAGHSLEGLVDPWVVSGSVGVRKPDRPLYEVLRRVTGEPPSNILVIDDDLENLDVAKDMGFGTAWFSAEGDRADARGHELFRSFEAADAALDTIDEAIKTIELRSGEPRTDDSKNGDQ